MKYNNPGGIELNLYVHKKGQYIYAFSVAAKENQDKLEDKFIPNISFE